MRSGPPKKALIVAPFFSAESISNRPYVAASVLSRIEPVDIVTTDFDHHTKSARVKHAPGDNQTIIYLETVRYASNISMRRFISHVLFAFKAARVSWKRRDEYDLVYVTLPLNLAACCIFFFCRNQVKIADVIDIWPDVLPFSRSVKLLLYPFFKLWKKTFQYAVGKADAVMTVSDFFYDESTAYFRKNRDRIKRFYIGHPALDRIDGASESVLTIGYVGNIGRLYDFATLLDALSKPSLKGLFQLYLVGEGDRREWLLKELRLREIPHVYFGMVYDKARLSRILARCDIGFNGYINTTASFSYKANTYLAAGLPILNSMGRDLHDLIEKYGIGFNYAGGDIDSLCGCLSTMNRAELKTMMRRSRKVFRTELEQNIIMDQMEIFITSLRTNRIKGNDGNRSEKITKPCFPESPPDPASLFGREPGDYPLFRLRN